MEQDQDTPEAVSESRASGPTRTCIVTRREGSPSDMVRFVVGPDHRVVPDLARKLPGRGVWVTIGRAQVERAVAARLFARAFRKPVEVSPDLTDRVGALLERRALDALALANKAGTVVAGFTRAEALIGAGEAVALVQARDASPDGLEKLAGLYRAVCRDLGRNTIVHRELTSMQMSLALGRDNVVHACLRPGGATTRLLDELRRLARYAGGTACDSSGGATTSGGSGTTPATSV